MMGGGMMQRNCDHCDGTGKVVKQIEDVLAKDTEAYKELLAKVKVIDISLTDAQVDEICATELAKIKSGEVAKFSIEPSKEAQVPYDEFTKIKRGRGRPKRGSNDTSRWQAN
jgi:hypothetical protein